MLCVTLMYTGSAHTAVKQTAIQLLHLLYRRFYLDNVLSSIPDTAEAKDSETAVGAEQQSAASQEKKLLQEMLLHGADSRSQMFISETLSRLLPDLTMPIFSGTYFAVIVIHYKRNNSLVKLGCGRRNASQLQQLSVSRDLVTGKMSYIVTSGN